jgi:ribulose-phosphate 3-epimerase
MEIVPAILERNFSHIRDKIFDIADFAKTVQIDICDGMYVQSITWPYGKSDGHFEAILKEEEGMPGWDKLDFEFDLMVKNPDPEYVLKWVRLGGSRIVIHSDSKTDLNDVFEALSGYAERGLAIRANTPLSIIDKYFDKIDYIQIMGIDKVGFQGQHFNPKVFEKIKEIKDKYSEIIIQIDGGVSLSNSVLLDHAGADRLVVGSALFDSDNLVDTYRKLVRT